MLSRSHQKI